MPLWRPKKRSRDTAVPTDSLSDIAFLLIIFFILTTSIRKVAGFKAEIPSAQKTEQQAMDKTPTAKLHNETLTFNDETIDLAGFRRKLKDLQLANKSPSEKIVVLEASGSVKYQLYYEVMAAISAEGGVVGIVSEDKGGRK
jgi:biopolymer transport protein ExbD